MSVKLTLGTYIMTRDKAKDMMTAIRPKLAKMVSDYELSGAGAGQMRSENADDYGHFYINRCEDGDDRRNCCKAHNDSFLLYWWHRLDTEGFVQFTICVLDKFHCANAKHFALVSDIYCSPSSRETSAKKEKKEIAKQMGT